GRILKYLPRPLSVEFGQQFGFTHDLETYMHRHGGSALDPRTLDAEKFSRHFAINGQPAPVIEVSGRLFPISMAYRPWQDEGDGGDLADQIATVVLEILQTKVFPDHQPVSVCAQDILCFLPGEREIRASMEAVQEKLAGNPLGQQVELIALYSRLTQAEQDRVFRPGGLRRVVFATNVAETSITVPRIGYVVDSGLARIKRYRVRGKVEQLQVEPISQAQAKQRAGRCGRVGPGICFRLFDEEDFLPVLLTKIPKYAALP
ncbi:MAG: helicase-related protein, partial [Burkholderiaceae bacterium]